VNYFDDKNQTIKHEGKEIILVNKENYKTIIQKIHDISPRGTTYISDACKKIQELQNIVGDEYCAHILFTDGLPTNQYKKSEQYCELLPFCDNYFIGFGESHDGKLLNGMAELSNDQYYFVDDIENAGIIYSEIIHEIINKSAINIQLKSTNCELFYNGEWTGSLSLPSLPSDSLKKIFVRCEADSTETLNIALTYNEFNDRMPHDKTYEFDNTVIAEITPEIEKQFLAIPVLNLMKESISCKDVSSMQKKLETLLDTLKKWKTENNLDNDLFMCGICDDLYITHEALNKRNGIILQYARYYSLLDQRTYQVRNLDIFEAKYHYGDNCESGGPIGRNMLSSGGTFRCAKFPVPKPVLSHQVSTSRTSSFASQTQQCLMRSITGDNTIGHDEPQ